ncbi:MAG TPA: VacJ family lipoprotein [Albidovulum sp.]|uniref:MlaA family lipoprotein n=1 Tax=Albidovulum sp. TaxID=1872424 RepID=UPI002C21BB3E|nr:VacJ family lipoprotein [Albidovulum sp.]
MPVSARFHAAPAAFAALAIVAGCSKPVPGAEFNDPYEKANRAVHEVNVTLDQAVFGGGEVPQRRYLPGPLAKGFSNAAYNLSMPSAVINNILQLNGEGATRDTFRFALNTTFGVGGLFDPAAVIGLYAEDADFGETLHVWGVPEGAFVVLPLAGPTTERDLAGAVVDFFIDPLGLVFDGKDYVAVEVVKVAGQVGNRQQYSALIESILYESADSYAQMRLSYLQYRRNKLGIKDEDVIDPYEDFYAP